LANAQITPGLPNPIAAPNPLTTTLSIFRKNMQDKIMNSADEMPDAKYSYRPTKEVRSFAEILIHVADISYTLCSNAKGEAPPGSAAARGSKAEIKAYLKGSFDYCDGVYSGFTDVHLNDPANFFGVKTNEMFILTQVGNHDALHYGNLVTYLRINGLEPSGKIYASDGTGTFRNCQKLSPKDLCVKIYASDGTGTFRNCQKLSPKSTSPV
jgi:uncharacterized damage-inducible protein DinB